MFTYTSALHLKNAPRIGQILCKRTGLNLLLEKLKDMKYVKIPKEEFGLVRACGIIQRIFVKHLPYT